MDKSNADTHVQKRFENKCLEEGNPKAVSEIVPSARSDYTHFGRGIVTYMHIWSLVSPHLAEGEKQNVPNDQLHDMTRGIPFD